MNIQHYGDSIGLGEITDAFASLDPNTILPIGIHEPHSYRGDYMDLSFEYAPNIRAGAITDMLRSCDGRTFQGYKGGDFTMDRHTLCWIAEYGYSQGDQIGPVLLHFLTHQTSKDAS